MKKTLCLLTLLCLLALSACGGDSSSEEASDELHLDANSKQYSDYAQALLKAIYTKDYADYMGMTGEAEGTVETIYNNHIANTADELQQHFGLVTLESADKDTLNQAVRQLYGHMNYRVVNVQQDSASGNYVVTIEVDRLNFVSQVDGVMDSYLDEMNRKMANRELDNMTTEEYNRQYNAKAMEAISGALSSLASTESCQIQLPFQADSTGAVSISEETLHNVTRKLLGL